MSTLAQLEDVQQFGGLVEVGALETTAGVLQDPYFAQGCHAGVRGGLGDAELRLQVADGDDGLLDEDVQCAMNRGVAAVAGDGTGPFLPDLADLLVELVSQVDGGVEVSRRRVSQPRKVLLSLRVVSDRLLRW